MSSELGLSGKKAMKALADMLGILSIKQAPSMLKTDELVPVIAADAGWSNYELVSTQGFGSFAAGEADLTLVLTGSPNNPGDPVLVEFNEGLEVLVLGFGIRIGFNAVAASAQAGKYLNFDIYMAHGTNTITPVSLRRLWQVSVADPVFLAQKDNYYSPASGGGGAVKAWDAPMWIPAGIASLISVYFDDGSAFLGGGGSVGWQVEAIGIKVPKGIKPPSIP